MVRPRFKGTFRTPRIAASAILLVAVLLSLSSHAEAKQVSGTVTVEEGDFYGWQLDVVVPSQIEVEVTGQDAAEFDLLVIDKADYSRYVDGLAFAYYVEYSALGTSSFSVNMTVLTGTVYILIDNSERPAESGAASPTGPVVVDFWLGSAFDFDAVPSQGNLWLMYLFIGVAGFTLVLVVFLARLAVKGRKKTEDLKRPGSGKS